MAVPILYLALLLCCVLGSTLSGSKTERVATAIMAISSVATYCLPGSADDMFGAVDVKLTLVDTATFAAMVVLARRSARFWPIWIAALQLLSVLANLVATLKPTSQLIAYAFNEEIWSWPILTIILISILARGGRLQGGTPPRHPAAAAKGVSTTLRWE